MTEDQAIDHRPRVGAERRERMRQRLVESALLVFAERGVGASVIQDVIATAKVSQGTFYNYFRTNDELLFAVSEELNNELLRLIESEVGGYEDPAKRIACGLRLYLHTVRKYPLIAKFVCQAGLHAAGPNNLVYELLPPHIAQGQAAGRFLPFGTETALDVIAGTSLAAVLRISSGEARSDYPENVVAAILRGLGMSDAQSRKLVALPLTPIDVASDSLLERGHARYMAGSAS